MVFAFAPHRVVKDAKRLQGLVESASAVQRNARERRGDIREAAFLGFCAIALDEAKHRLYGKTRVLEEFHALRVAICAALREASVDLRKPCAKPVAYRRSEVRRQVEDNTLLAKGRACGATRVHLGVRVKVGDLPYSSQKGDALAIHELRTLGFEHFLKANPGTRLVANSFRDKPLKKRLPVDIAAKLRLLLVKRPIQQTLNSLGHLNIPSHF